MFDQLKGTHFTCGLDNLYFSAKFCRAAISETKQKVMTHGVCRVHDRGLPQCVIMPEQTSDAAKARARGSVKAAVLKDDTKFKDMVAFSAYDTKPVHFISTAATSLKWVKTKRRVYDTRSNQSVDMHFLRTELQDKYNNGMKDVDISDQLRKIYCLNR